MIIIKSIQVFRKQNFIIKKIVYNINLANLYELSEFDLMNRKTHFDSYWLRLLYVLID